MVSQQEYDPWGKVRTGGIGQTTLNYTGQRLDGTGLVYYHARYYDPSLARFVSPDSIVPGASPGAGGALGTIGQEQNSLLTVDFHEGALLSGLNGDNALTLQKGYWFQLSGQDRQRAREPWGPHNPQALNRYAYVLDNPVRYVDPTGHAVPPYDDDPPIGPVYTGPVQQAGFGTVIRAILRFVGRIVVAPRPAYGTNFARWGTYVKDPNIAIISMRAHAINQMAKRGITEQTLKSWQTLDKAVTQLANGDYLYITKEGAWIVNKAGELQTAWSRANFFPDLELVARALGIIK